MEQRIHSTQGMNKEDPLEFEDPKKSIRILKKE